jgi:hypothetical protein
MRQNHRRAAPAIDPTKNSTLFEVPSTWLLGDGANRARIKTRLAIRDANASCSIVSRAIF